MFKFWRFLDGTTLLFDPDDGGGLGGDDGGGDDGGGDDGGHPDFEIPAGVGGADDGDQGAGNPPGDPNGQSRAGAGGQPAGRPRGAQPPVENVPKHRLDEVIGQRDQLNTRIASTEAELNKLRAFVANVLGIADPSKPGAGGGQPKQLSPREQAIQNRILELVPWLKNLQSLADKAESLTGLADQMPAFEKQSQQYWTRVATTMLEGMEEQIAPLFLGEGKKASDLSPELKSRYRVDFFNWIQADPQRVERYEGLDRSLIDDYRKELDAQVIQPLRRQYGAAALNRGRQVGKLPVGGNSSAPHVTPKPKTAAPADEDAAADAAWANFQERMAQG